jgi:regulator of sirC expression with transglutaminase-like and TPR domain
LLDLPEDKIDVGRAALIFGKEIYSAIDIEAYSRKIDVMATEAGRFVRRYGPRGDPESIIRALNTYYYKVWRVRYDNSFEGRAKQENNFLHHTLDTKEGQCITIPMLYMAFAQRLGYPTYGVLAPEHTFVRFVDPRLEAQNIELTAEAGFEPDEGYAYRLNVSQKAISSGAYLRTLSRRQYLGVLVQQNAIAIGARGDLDKSIRYFECAARLDPQNVYFPKNLHALWMRKAALASSPEWAGKYREIAFRYFEQAENMGWTRDPDANTRGKK